MTTPPPTAHDNAHGMRPPEAVDRLMVGACGAIWIVFLVVAAIAGVALANLGTGRGGGQHSSWLLYTIIGVSAAVIAGAIPLLIRARRTAMGEVPTNATAEPSAVPRPADAPTEKIRVFGTTVDPHDRAPEPVSPSRSHAVVERIWLRGTASLLGATGLALIAVATAAYLLAVYSDTAAWVALGVAGIITSATPAVLVFLTRQLGEVSPAG